MMYKLIFGIILPLMIIISLAIIASYGEVKEEREFLKVISIQTVLKDGNIRDKVKIGDIVLTNDFTLPKRYELPLFGACLIDSEKEKENAEVGSVDYYEGDYVHENDFNNLYGSGRSYKSIEVKSGEKKKITVYLTPNYYYYNNNYTELLERYKGYDSVVIYEKKERKSSNYPYSYRDYVSCYNLNEEDIKDSIKIQLTP